MAVAAGRGRVAGRPNVHVDNVEGSGDGPRVDKLAAAVGLGVGEDTFWAGDNPTVDVFPASGPKEA